MLEARPLSTEQLATGSNEVKPTDNCTTDGLVVTKLKERDIDEALEKTADIISKEFKSWYAKRARELGYFRYMGLAHDARRGKQPAKLFSYLLRRA